MENVTNDSQSECTPWVAFVSWIAIETTRSELLTQYLLLQCGEKVDDRRESQFIARFSKMFFLRRKVEPSWCSLAKRGLDRMAMASASSPSSDGERTPIRNIGSNSRWMWGRFFVWKSWGKYGEMEDPLEVWVVTERANRHVDRSVQRSHIQVDYIQYSCRLSTAAGERGMEPLQWRCNSESLMYSTISLQSHRLCTS